MKKKLLTFILVGTMLTAASVIGCGKSAQDAQTSANTETKADTETVAEDNADSETGSVQINGGIENDGIDLMEDDGLYRTVTLDDYPVYYSVGKVTLPLSEDVTFEDQADQNQESDLPVVELNDLPAAIENSDMAFNCNNTVITVRQGQIVQIIRYWAEPDYRFLPISVYVFLMFHLPYSHRVTRKIRSTAKIMRCIGDQFLCRAASGIKICVETVFIRIDRYINAFMFTLTLENALTVC